MRSEHQQRVDKFMILAGQDVPAKPVMPSAEQRCLRAKLILEEALETIRLGLGVRVVIIGNSDITDQDNIKGGVLTHFVFTADYVPSIVEIVDGCCDLKVVTTGTLSACGVDDVEPQALVDSNNLAKFGPGGYRRDDGKWIKPPDHQPPDIAGELIRQGWSYP